MTVPVTSNSDPPPQGQRMLALRSYPFLADFIESFDNEAIRNIVKSVTYDPEQRTIIIELNNLLRRESDKIDLRRSQVDLEGDRKVRQLSELSEKYKEQYPILVQSFNKWRKSRKELISTSFSSAEELDNNFANSVIMRLTGSSAEIAGIFGNMVLSQLGYSYWSQFALTTATCFGFLGLFYTASEVVRSKHIHKKVIRAVETDQETFEDVKKWLEQTNELKTAVKGFFPYGIDEDLVKEIEKSSSEADECLKIFISAIVSNVPKNAELSTDVKFLEKVQFFSCSEAAKQWWNRIILEQNPLYIEGMKAFVNSDVPAIKELGCCAETLLPVDAVKFIAMNTQVKLLLCGLSIYAAYNDLVEGTKCETSEKLRRLGRETQKELKAVETMVQHLEYKET